MTKTPTTRADKQMFQEALMDFRKAGYLCTWSVNGGWVIMTFYDVSFPYRGYAEAARRLRYLLKQWKNEA